MASTRTKNHRRGFTLVEMLVAVALVLLMMTMFAQIFKTASDTITIQRGIANNDQKARMLVTVMRADFDKRDMRNMVPFYQNEDPNTSPTNFNNRQGYFYLSTNDRFDGSDTVLQFTVNSRIIVQNEDESPYYGKGTLLLPDDSGAPGDLIGYLVGNPNQPEADDERVEPNGTTDAPAAEVAYFLRGGNLYRRVLLIREPLELASQTLTVQPESNGTPPVNFFNHDGDVTTPQYYTLAFPSGGAADTDRPNFWSDFDHAAIATFDFMTGDQASAATFHGLASLNNENLGSVLSLGKPQNRFGHNTDPAGVYGLSREFTLPPGGATPTEFIGRFTHEETSFVDPDDGDLRFGYPQELAAYVDTGGNNVSAHPMDVVNAPMSLNDRGAIAEFTNATTGIGGARRSEELLLGNVHEFRVEIWDDRLQKFVDPSHAESSTAGEEGDYHEDRKLNTAYGPNGAATANAVFDTWHPGMSSAGEPDVVGSNGQPPFRAMVFYPPRSDQTIGGRSAGPSPPSMPGPFAPPAGGANDPYWTQDFVYEVGDIVFPLTEDLNQNGLPDEEPFLNFPADGVVQSHAPAKPHGFTYHFRCVQAGRSRAIPTPATASQHLALAPNWQFRQGALISEDYNGNGIPGEPAGTAGAPDGEPIWIAVPNLRPVRAIRVTLRFLDQGTDTVRQVSITHSLMD